MPSGWEWVIGAVAVLCLFCAAMAAYHSLRIRVTYAWVQVFGRRFEWRRGHRKGHGRRNQRRETTVTEPISDELPNIAPDELDETREHIRTMRLLPGNFMVLRSLVLALLDDLDAAYNRLDVAYARLDQTMPVLHQHRHDPIECGCQLTAADAPKAEPCPCGVSRPSLAYEAHKAHGFPASPSGAAPQTPAPDGGETT